MNTTASAIGLDIAKNIFVAVGRDARGKILWKKTLARDEVLPSFANLPPTLVGIEACSGSHYWARQLNGLGQDVKLIAAQHTRVYVTGNKNDANDAAAIAEARSRAATKYVSINTQAQQDLQMLHRARQALVDERKAMICRIRAFAHEYGQIFPVGVAKFRARLTPWLADMCNGLSANLGLIPREHSSGGKQRLYGINKRGDRYLRTLLIHGARSALRWADGKDDRILRWALKLAERRGQNVAAVALANKLARIVWAMLAHGRDYRPNYGSA